MSEASFQIVPARSSADLDAVKLLFTAYASALGIDLSYQGFEEELAGLPGKYAAPSGALLIARAMDGEPLGCVALRPLDDAGHCEMKRLYVSPRARGLGLGKALIDAVIAEAIRIGYREMRLDTLPTMGEAIALYRKASFQPIDPYYETPVAGTIFMGRRLNRDDSTP
jgi:ribosomal protein S18 acetylase RimI-like enzyme